MAELDERRRAIARWAEHHLGFMGRAPDHVAGFFAGFAAEPEVLAQPGNEAFAENAVTLYEFFRDNDVYVSYTIVPPQIDRSKPAHLQSPSDLYAGVVAERDDGVVIRGAQMLGTGTVFSDCLHLSTIHPLQPGDENHAVSLVVACNTPGLKIYPRRSYATNASSTFDYPLSSRFDETDALVVFDDVLVPHRQSHYATMSLQSKIYPRVLETLRELSGGGMIQLPASADDLMSEAAGADLRRYVQSPEVTAEARVKLLKLAWDAVGSEFGGRHAQYEKFYAGAPFIVKTRFSRNYDFDGAEGLVTRALEKYSL